MIQKNNSIRFVVFLSLAALVLGSASAQDDVAKDKQLEIPELIGKVHKGRGHRKASISPDGNTVAVTLHSKVQFFVWNETSEEFVSTRIDVELKRAKNGFRFLAGGTRMAAVGPFKRIQIVEEKEPGGWAEINKIDFEKEYAINQAGTVLATYDRKHKLTFVNVDTNNAIASLENPFYPDKRIRGLFLNDSGQQLVAIQGDRLILVDAKKAKVVQTAKLNSPKYTITGNGKYIVSNSDSAVVEIKTGQSYGLPRGIEMANVTPDGNWIVYIKDMTLHFQSISTENSISHAVKIPCEHSHWHSIDFAVESPRLVLAEVFSDDVFVFEYPSPN